MKKLLIILGALSFLFVTTAVTTMNSSKGNNVVSIKTDKVTDITMTSVKCFFTIAGNNLSLIHI